MEHIFKDTALLCNTIKLGTHYAMMNNSRNDINQIINNIAKQEEINKIRIYNKEGRIKFSNQINEVDKYTNIRSEACIVCHKTDPPKSKIEFSRRTRLIPGDKNTRYLGIITSIENEPGCSRSACHVHKPEETILGAIDVVLSLSEKDLNIKNFKWRIIALAILVFLFTSAIISVLMVKFLKEPIQKLIMETDDIAKGNFQNFSQNGKFPISSQTVNSDEIGQLAMAINQMGREIARNQAELKKQKDEYQNLFANVPCEISVIDKNFKLIRYNSRFAEKFKPRQGDFCFHAYKGLEQKCSNCPVEKTFEDGKPHSGEETGYKKNGEITHWILATTPIMSSDNKIIAAMEMSLDITNTRLLETRLEVTEKKYHAIFNNIPNPVFVLDTETLEIIDCNHSVEIVYGFDRKELINKTFMVLFVEEERKNYASQIRQNHDIIHVKHKHKSGRTIYVNIRIALSEYEGRKELLVTTSDITKRLEAEQQLIQASKMATLGEMATGIAHELNQPLTVIKTASNFFIKKINRKETIDEDVLFTLATEIDSYINRATRIINHMREFGRKSDMSFGRVELNTIIKKAFDIFSQQLKLRGIEVIWDLDENLPFIWGDATRLEQVFVNLLINARDAIEGKWAEVTDRENADKQEEEKKIFLRSRHKNDKVQIEVEDTGKGIDPVLIDKIFEPFFTTKEVGKGTGLGLSISYGIIRECRGNILAVPGKTRGACFIITFPVYEEEDDDLVFYH